jgi:hypothetical protein
MKKMKKVKKVRFFSALILCFCSLAVAQAQEEQRGDVPDMLRRPQRGEAPRYPEDTIIGPIGAGQASAGAYSQARSLMSALVRKDQDALTAQFGNMVADEFLAKLNPITPRTFRIGSGREEPDGTTSFLVRFIGREKWIVGELFLRSDATGWRFDALVLEGPQDANETSYHYDFSPYERFF